MLTLTLTVNGPLIVDTNSDAQCERAHYTTDKPINLYMYHYLLQRIQYLVQKCH